jgi:hypothetical protein
MTEMERNERELFETWWKSIERYKPLRNKDNEYELAIAESAWKAWLYRARKDHVYKRPIPGRRPKHEY